MAQTLEDSNLTQLQYIICGQRDTCQGVNKLFHPSKNQKISFFGFTNEATNKYIHVSIYIYLIRSSNVSSHAKRILNYVRILYVYIDMKNDARKKNALEFYFLRELFIQNLYSQT